MPAKMPTYGKSAKSKTQNVRTPKGWRKEAKGVQPLGEETYCADEQSSAQLFRLLQPTLRQWQRHTSNPTTS